MDPVFVRALLPLSALKMIKISVAKRAIKLPGFLSHHR